MFSLLDFLPSYKDIVRKLCPFNGGNVKGIRSRNELPLISVEIY